MTSNDSKVAIQFHQGIDELVIPEIRLSRNRDGRNGQAIFSFKSPEALGSENYKDIKGMFLLDEEGQISTRDVNIVVTNGKKTAIKATYKWNTDNDFDRFMRFAQRYANKNNLGYEGS